MCEKLTNIRFIMNKTVMLSIVLVLVLASLVLVLVLVGLLVLVLACPVLDKSYSLI